MLLTLSTTRPPATDLGWLLHKHPERPQSVELSFGKAHVFYPDASDTCCTVALLLEVDPVGLVRGRGPSGDGHAPEQYVNDRPWVASSFLSVAIAQAFRSALAGTCKARPELVDQPLPLEATLSVLPCRGGEPFLRALFEPLGYTVSAARHPLDARAPEWGESRYFTVTLSGTLRLTDLLSHLYVLVPVLDDDKHYWVGDDEVEKLLRHGEGWLGVHPQREVIATRYLKHRRSLARAALERLVRDEVPDDEDAQPARDREEDALEAKVSLDEQRLAQVVAVLRESGARTVVDLGCGEGRLVKALLAERQFTKVTGVDVSVRALEVARDRLNLDRLSELQRRRVELLHGSLVYRDQRLAGFDAAAVVEVIEHLDPFRLEAFERALFEAARPPVVVVTTPNAEFNVKFESLPAGAFRHRDHRFEWTRAEFAAWADAVAQRHGYAVRYQPVGGVDPVVGAPTQLAVFSR